MTVAPRWQALLLAGPAAATLIATLPEVNTNMEFCSSPEAESAMAGGHNP